MKIVFMGTPDFASICLEKLIGDGFDEAAVVTQPDKPKGRGYDMAFSAVKECALTHGIEVLQPQKVKENPEFKEKLASYNADVFAVVAYGKILPKEILDMPKYGCVNVHASLLPKYRGAAPIQWAVVNGEKESGVATMLMDEGMDTGDILDVCRVEIPEDMTGGELFDRLAEVGASLLCETLNKLENGTATRQKQDDALATYAPIIKKEDGRIDFSKSASAVKNHIRGFYPWPCAFTKIGDTVMKVFSAEISGDTKKPACTVVSADKQGLVIACGENTSVIIKEIQAVGGKRMTVGAYLNGHEIKVGETV